MALFHLSAGAAFSGMVVFRILEPHAAQQSPQVGPAAKNIIAPVAPASNGHRPGRLPNTAMPMTTIPPNRNNNLNFRDIPKHPFRQ